MLSADIPNDNKCVIIDFDQEHVKIRMSISDSVTSITEVVATIKVIFPL